jgi:hypothetical protein
LKPKFGKIAGALGSVLIVFKLIMMFIPKEPSPELLALQQGFMEMHQRFDQLSAQINQLGNKIDFYQSIGPYQQVRDDLENVNRDYVRLIESGTSITNKLYKERFAEACSNQRIEPEQALEKLHRIIVNPGVFGMPHIAESAAIFYKLDYKQYMQFFELIISDAYKLAILRSACFGALYPNDTSGENVITNQAAKWVQEIVDSLANYEKQITNFDSRYIEAFRSDVQQVFDTAEYNATAEKLVNAKCAEIKLMATGKHKASCEGESQVNNERIAINNHLQTKYPWLKFAVVVMQTHSDNSDPMNACEGDKSRYFVLKNGWKRAFVSWSKPSPMIEENVKKAVSVLRTAIIEKNYGEDVKKWAWYDPIPAAQGEIKQRLNTLHSNRIYCNFNGWNDKYYRSIYTADIGTFITHWVEIAGWLYPPHWKNDYFISFYI